MFDSLGNERSGIMVFSRQSTDTWTARFEHSGGFAETSPIYLTGNVKFDDRGILSANSLGAITLSPDLGARPMSVGVNVGAIGQATGFTSFASDNTAVLSDQTGYAAGELSSVSLDSSGTITGSFTNGRTRILGQVAVANFTNPAGLASKGDNVYTQSNNSGEAQIGIAGQGGRGALQSGALEGSNVDLAQTFSDLIVAQRGFQSNSRIISSSDEVLQELMNLKR
ncbi:Flagellar hook protein FlgE [compost metagenome]